MLLTQTTTPEDVKALNRAELPQLCDEIRHAILESSAAVGGHVAPNLGVVELTVALHRVFNSPTDKIVFDVSHQTYAHKALTGRTPISIRSVMVRLLALPIPTSPSTTCLPWGIPRPR